MAVDSGSQSYDVAPDVAARRHEWHEPNKPLHRTEQNFTASGPADDDAWHELFPEPSNDPGNAPGGYRFEGGAGTGNNVAGGRPNDGILIGETGLFTFRFDGLYFSRNLTL